MLKMSRSLMLMAALAFCAGSTVTLATAQETKKADPKKAADPKKKVEEKADSKADPKADLKATGAGTIELKKNVEKGTWRYIIKNAEGTSIAMPLAHLHWESKEECLKAVEELKLALNKGKITDFKDSKDAKDSK